MTLITALCLLTGFSALRGKKIEDSLDGLLQGVPADSLVTVLVRPALEVDLLPLENDLRRRRAPRAERHERMVRTLKQKSAASQASIVSHLDDVKTRRGTVREVQPFWITNIVAVTATPDEIRALAERQDVAEILENRTIYLQAGEKQKTSPPADAVGASALSAAPAASPAQSTRVFNWALERIKARELWKRGLTGRGVVVAIIDSGADGDHPALRNKWRGANGATVNESWFDPITGTRFPVDDLYLPSNPGLTTHGTGVMGCLVGQSGADTVGVAPDAQWIAAKAFNSLGNALEANIILCLQWAADPDGNPATLDDVPDILNLSFADKAVTSIDCQKTYWEAIYNLQNMGVAVFIAAGNENTYVGSPASNPDFFGVGAVDSLNVKWYTRGPSPCDRSKIKPDVVAPGVNIQSTRGALGTGGYSSRSGTSFASPLTAGVGALLRQYNPELAPEEVYNVIRGSAFDLGAAGPDTIFGWGLVNAESALGGVTAPSRPSFAVTSISVSAGEDNTIDPGEQVILTLGVINNGASASSVNGALASLSADVNVTTGTASFGSMPAGIIRNNSPAFVLQFSPLIPRGVLRQFRLALSAGAFSDTVTFSLAVGGVPEQPTQSYASHDINRAGLALTNYGVLGTDSDDGGGFLYPRGTSQQREHLYQGALLLATGPATISDAGYSETQPPGNAVSFNYDFAVAQNGNIVKSTPGLHADQQISGVYNDSRATIPLGITVTQFSYAWSAAPDEEYAIVEYNLAGPSNRNVDGLHVAVHMDWDVGGSSGGDRAGFDRNARLAYMYDSNGGSWVGHALLTQGVAGFRALEFNRDISNGFTAAVKFAAMTEGGGRDTLESESGDWSVLLSAGPVYLKPGRNVPVAFAVIGGSSLAELRARASAARERYSQVAAARGLDLTPPSVRWFQLPDSNAGLASHTVRALVEDDTALERTMLFWRSNPQSPFTRVNLTTGSGDTLTASFPGQPSGSRVEYYLRSIDASGNQGFHPSGAPDTLFSFNVVDFQQPVISQAAAVADTTAGTSRYFIQARVEDNNLDRVFAVYATGDDQFRDTLALAPSGGGGMHRGTVEGLERGVTVRYYIAALDSSGHLVLDPGEAPGSFHSFAFTPPGLLGDGDLNGRLDIFDLLAMLRVLGRTETPSPEQFFAMDIDKNGKIDIFDLLALLRLLAS